MDPSVINSTLGLHHRGTEHIISNSTKALSLSPNFRQSISSGLWNATDRQKLGIKRTTVQYLAKSRPQPSSIKHAAACYWLKDNFNQSRLTDQLYNIIDWQILFTWLWRWLPLRLSKRLVTNNSSSQNYPNPDDHTIRTTDTPGFKPFTKYEKR